MRSSGSQLLAAFLIGLVPSFALASQQAPTSAAELRNPTTNDAPCYRIRHVTYTSPGYPREVLIVISIDPKHFVKEDMIALAYDLRNLYSSEPRFGAIILDDDDLALHSSPIHRKEEYLLARRGFYYSNRGTGEEHIQFSTERGRPWSEVRIDLSKRK